ncbi:hypothetical protein VCHC44C1_3331B, partial [Vibrio cholerae HC-44C1]
RNAKGIDIHNLLIFMD